MAKKNRAPTNPDEKALRDLGMSFPEATEEFPWDHRALKVKGRVFVFMGTGKEAGADDDQFFLSCKLPHSASLALNLPGVKPTGYGLGKSGWVSAQFPPGKAPVDMLKEWIRESYCAIAPKKLAMLLDETSPVVVTKAAASKGGKKKAAETKKTTKKASSKAKKKKKKKKSVSTAPKKKAAKKKAAKKKAAARK